MYIGYHLTSKSNKASKAEAHWSFHAYVHMCFVKCQPYVFCEMSTHVNESSPN